MEGRKIACVKALRQPPHPKNPGKLEHSREEESHEMKPKGKLDPEDEALET